MALSNGPNLGVLVDGGIGETHYAALTAQWRAIDALIQGRVISHTLTTPPVSPVDGDCYVVPTGAAGVWSANANKIARYSTKIAAWEYYTPKAGWLVFSDAASRHIVFKSGAWIIYDADKADLVDGKVPSSQLPSYVDDVLEFDDYASLPVTGETGKIYVTIDTNDSYRWSGSVYVKTSQPLYEIPQETIEAGTDSSLFALTARRVRQAITAWWNGITNIDGKNIGATSAGTGRFTTLTTTGSATVGGAAPTATIAGTTLYPSTTPFVEVVRTSGDAPQDTLMVLRQTGLAAAAHKKRVGMLFKHSSEGSTGESVKMTGIWSETVSSFSNLPDLVVSVGDAERARFTPTGLSITGNLTTTGNTTLGDSSSDTVTINGTAAIGGTPNPAIALLIEPTYLAGASAYGVISRPTADSAKTNSFSVYANVRTAASAFTLTNGYSLYAGDAAKGAGSAITNQYGVFVADQAQGTNNYGITSQVSAGANKLNLNIIGTADNVLMGNTGIGTASPVAKLDVVAGATGAETVVGILRSNFTTNGTGTTLRLTNSTTALTNVGSVELAAVRTNAGFTGDTDAIIRSCNSAGVMADRMKFTSTGVVRPGADNTQSLGEASFRWSEVFAGTGTINTSDATLKTDLRPFTDAELDAIGECRLGIFQWLDSVADKGDSARLHPGVIAQQIMSAFESRDLDPLRYAPICRDMMTTRVQTNSVSVWKKRPVLVKEIARDERIEIIDGVPTVVVTEREVESPKTELRRLIGADGLPVTEEVQARDEAGELLYLIEDGKEPTLVLVEQPVMHPCPVEEEYLDFEPVFEDLDAGWRYGIRYSQLLVMIAAYERRERERLADRVAALESA